MHGRPIRTSLGSEPYGSALVCTGPKFTFFLTLVSIAFFVKRFAQTRKWKVEVLSESYTETGGLKVLAAIHAYSSTRNRRPPD